MSKKKSKTPETSWKNIQKELDQFDKAQEEEGGLTDILKNYKSESEEENEDKDEDDYEEDEYDDDEDEPELPNYPPPPPPVENEDEDDYEEDEEDEPQLPNNPAPASLFFSFTPQDLKKNIGKIKETALNDFKTQIKELNELVQQQPMPDAEVVISHIKACETTYEDLQRIYKFDFEKNQSAGFSFSEATKKGLLETGPKKLMAIGAALIAIGREVCNVFSTKKFQDTGSRSNKSIAKIGANILSKGIEIFKKGIGKHKKYKENEYLKTELDLLSRIKNFIDKNARGNNFFSGFVLSSQGNDIKEITDRVLKSEANGSVQATGKSTPKPN